MLGMFTVNCCVSWFSGTNIVINYVIFSRIHINIETLAIDMEHKNGIYNWRIVWSGNDGPIYQNGLVKIITQPGGDLGIKEFISTPQTEERVSEVFYRPNY